MGLTGMEEQRNSYNILAGKSAGNRPIRRPRRSWVDNIKMNLKEIGWGGMNWIDIVEDREKWRALVNRVMNFRVP
jgi:hypothetical protein